MRQVVKDFTADYKTTYMLYRLLRNNKESGPFTALQLKDMGLKPYDLLWTEGRGAAWQYASEINELKDFAPVVEEQPFERFNKRKETLESVAQPAVAAKKVKPRYRISNGQLIMVEAGSMEVGTNGVIKETMPVIKEMAPIHHINTTPVENKTAETPDWQKTYPQWQPQVQPKKEVKAEEPVEIETKYSESLDDLKKRYAEKVLGDKKEPSSSSISSASVKQNIMAIVALVVLVAGGYIGYTLKKKDDASVSNGQAKVERADIAGNNTTDAQLTSGDNATSDESTPVENNSNTAQNKPQIKAGNTTESSVIGASANAGNASTANAGNNKPANVAAQKKNADVVAKTNATSTDKAANKLSATDSKATVKESNAQPTTGSVAKNNNVSPTPTTLPAVPVSKPAQKQISDYVAVKKLGGSGAGVQNIKLMVSNVSDFPIDLAVVDIQYFDSKGKYQKGETMYVKDINGGNNVEVRVPDSDKSSTIKYKVSMVQADQKTLYMVAD